MFKKLLELDRDLLIYLNNLGIEKYDSFWLFVTNPISWLPLYLLLPVLIWFCFDNKNFYRILIHTLAVFVLTSCITFITKVFISRVRPSNLDGLHEILRVLAKPESFSFFSGHAANSFGIATFIILIFREKSPWRYLLYTWPILFSYSRIYVGVHYPSDILTGTMAGILIAYTVYRYFYLKIK